MKTKSKKIMGLLLALVMLIGCLPFNIIETYAAPGDVAIDATNFPDENFRDYVKKKFDKDNSGALSQDELDDVSSINIMEMNISSVKGIEYFSNLLSFEGYRNKLTELDISHNPALTYVGCGDNQLTALDISHNPALTHVGCRGNQLTALDISHNPALTKVSCDYNQLTALDLSHNPALEYFTCDNNQLKELDISHNPALIEFFCNNNQLTALDISNNPTLTQVRCSDNQLTALDISNNPALTNVDCDNNQLTALDISHNPALEYFYCGNNQLKELDLSHNPALTRVECGNNQLTSLDLSNNTALTSVVCDNNQLTTLDLSNNTALQGLKCNDNKLTTLKLPSSPIEDKNINQKYIISVPKGTSIMDFPAGFDVNKIQGTVAGLNITSSGIEWDEQTKISFQYKLCDSPELIVKIDVDTEEGPNPDLEKAIELVGKAETEKTEENYTKAKEAVDALVKGSGKTGLETQLKELRTSLDELKEAKEKAKEEIGKLPNLNEDEKAPFIKKVDDAQSKGDVEKAVEDARNADDLKAYKEKAKEEIGKLSNLSDTEKDEYKGKVDNATDKSGVDQAVNDAKAKDAENKNAADEKNKPATADDKNKAKDEIDKLPNLSDDEKDKYKKQVDDAQTKGDVAKIVEEAKEKSAGGQTPPTPTPTPTPNPSVDRDHDYWYRPYWTYSYGTSNTTIQKPVKTNLVKLESKLVIGSKEMVKSVDGVEQKINMDIAPFIEGNRTMLPIRFVAESLGFNVQWDKESRTVILIDKENVVKIPVDTNQIIVNGKVYESDVKPVIRNNRTMLPIANIARALGLKDGTDIIWNAATKEVKINREIEK